MSSNLIFEKSHHTNLDIYIDTTLITISCLMLGVISYSCLKIIYNLFCCSRKTKIIIRNKYIPKEVFILRGVSGIGKDNFIYYNEVNKIGNYAKVSTDDYFYNSDRKFHFETKNINKSNAFCLDKFHCNLQFAVPRIYVSNVNNKIWMYSNYVNIARSYGYKVKVIEIVCNSTDYLKYFNSRSIHNVPMSYSKKTYYDWEVDSSAELYEAYIGNRKGYLPGDSIPYPIKTEEQLDRELLEYMENRTQCSIHSESDSECESESESESESDSECESKSESEINKNYPKKIIPHISNDTIKSIRKRLLKISRIGEKKDKLKIVQSPHSFSINTPYSLKYCIN